MWGSVRNHLTNSAVNGTLENSSKIIKLCLHCTCNLMPSSMALIGVLEDLAG